MHPHLFEYMNIVRFLNCFVFFGSVNLLHVVECSLISYLYLDGFLEMVVEVKRGLVSMLGVCMSIGGVIGVLLSNVMSMMLVSVLAALSGLFTLAIRSQNV